MDENVLSKGLVAGGHAGRLVFHCVLPTAHANGTGIREPAWQGER